MWQCKYLKRERERERERERVALQSHHTPDHLKCDARHGPFCSLLSFLPSLLTSNKGPIPYTNTLIASSFIHPLIHLPTTWPSTRPRMWNYFRHGLWNCGPLLSTFTTDGPTKNVYYLVHSVKIATQLHSMVNGRQWKLHPSLSLYKNASSLQWPGWRFVRTRKMLTTKKC